MTKPFALPAHFKVGEPDLLFHPDRRQDRHPHPLIGLLRFGPFSRATINSVLDPIRIATIYPQGFGPRVRNLFNELEQRHKPSERLNYLVEFPGFSRIFGVRAVPAGLGTAHIQLHSPLGDEIAASARPELKLSEALTSALNRLMTERHAFDVIMIFLPEAWERAFYGEEDDFDLHDYLKAVNASRSVPTQIVREGSALSYPCRASVMWRLGIALYTKAGGVPWKLADTQPEDAYIGLSYAMRFPEDGSNPRFVTCCSQVFDSDGAGLEFIAYETDDVRIIRDNPFLTRNEMRRVMARSLALYQRRHAGRSPKRVVIHKTTEFKRDEVDGCFDAWASAEELELYQIQQDTIWRGILIQRPTRPADQVGQPAAYPCERGSYFQLGSREVLIWTQGNAPDAVGGGNFYKEGKGIPQPIVLKRFAGHSNWELPVAAVMGLSKMNWNNDALYDRMPVTISYATTLANTVKRMPKVLPKPYEFRLFM